MSVTIGPKGLLHKGAAKDDPIGTGEHPCACSISRVYMNTAEALPIHIAHRVNAMR